MAPSFSFSALGLALLGTAQMLSLSLEERAYRASSVTTLLTAVMFFDILIINYYLEDFTIN